MTRPAPVLGITPGDPAGIGPEILPAAVAAARDLPIRLRILGDPSPASPGEPNEVGARRAMEALEEAATLAAKGEIAGVVTGPVSKNQLHKVGFAFPGQTEFFADRAGVQDFAMLLTGGNLTVALVTTHVPLADVPRLLSSKEIVRVGRLLDGFLIRRGIPRPRIAVAGLNPHAGENGDIGDEETTLIAPAARQLAAALPHSEISGPHSPDAVFREAVENRFDAVLCMYHDQGLIPLKLHAFDCGVNVTLGLPHVRVSPDHGTAFAIAGKGLASPSSMIAAIRLAAELAT